MIFVKRTVLIILALCLCVGMISCKKDKGEEQQEDTPVETVSFLDYSVVRTESMSDIIIDDVVKMYKRLLEVSASGNSLSDDFFVAGEEPSSETKEILVGHTNRPETEEVLSKLGKNEYAVAVVGNKIVIVGIADSLTSVAIDYFMDTYLGEGADGEIEKELFYSATADVTTLVDSGEAVATLVRPKNAEQEMIDLCLGITKAVNTVAGVPLPMGSDTLYEEDEEATEIFFGPLRYKTAQTFLATVNPNQCKIDVKGNKIVIGAGTIAMYKKVAEMFSDYISDACYTDADGNTNVIIPEITVEREDSKMDFVNGVPNTLGDKAYDSAYDAHDGVAMMYWTGVAEKDAVNYFATLEANGFSKHQELDNDSIISATYFNNEATVCAYYFKRTNEFRVAAQEGGILPVNEYEYETLYNDVKVTQYALNDDGAWKGLGIVIRLKDGTFVVIDGGETPEYDSKQLYDTLISQMHESFEKPVISAWILTHAHSDHFNVLKYFTTYYNNKVIVKRLIGNAISDYEYEINGWPRDYDYVKVNGKFGGCVNDKAHAGQQYCFPGVTITILYTHEDKYPSRVLPNVNDASVVFDTVIEGMSAPIETPVNAGSIRFVWLGDIGSEASRIIVEKYKEDLACDVVQIAHHGMGGNHVDLYTLCAPEMAFLPAGSEVAVKHYDKYLGSEINNQVLIKNGVNIIYRHKGTYTMTIGDLLNIESMTGGEDYGSDYSKDY